MNGQFTWSDKFLRGTGKAWFLVAVAGQFAFVAFILAYYGTRTASGDFAAWNDKEIIKGHVEGDGPGNAMFAVHVLLAAVMTFGGVLQLVPALRRRVPALHRWNGRLFVLTAMILASGGLWLTWVRGTYLSWESAAIVSVNGVLILICAAQAVRLAMAKRFVEHERWAMRTFMVANGVWFFRLFLMAWILANQGPVGMNATLSGPADIGIAVASYLAPLLALEVYQSAKKGSDLGKIAAGSLVIVLTAITALGVFGATMFMWWPDMT